MNDRQAAAVNPAAHDPFESSMPSLSSYVARALPKGLRGLPKRVRGLPGRVRRLPDLVPRRFDAALLIDRHWLAEGLGRAVRERDKVALYEAAVAEGHDVSPHPLFDPAHYRREVRAAGLVLPPAGEGGPSPVRHMASRRPDVSPTPYFDPRFYRWAYMSRPVRWTTLDPARRMGAFEHYLRLGARRDAHPHRLFDPSWVRERLRLTPDDEEGDGLLAAYLRRARNDPDATPHPLIDPGYLRAQLGSAEGEPLALYRAAERAGAKPHPLFDPPFHAGTIHDGDPAPPPKAPAASSDDPAPPSDGPAPPSDGPRTKRPQPFALLPGETLLEHFLRVCSHERPLDPSSLFSSRGYWRRYPDIGPMNPLYHYVRHGRGEGRERFVPVAPPAPAPVPGPAYGVSREGSAATREGFDAADLVAIEPALFGREQAHDAVPLVGGGGGDGGGVGGGSAALMGDLLAGTAAFRPTLVALLSAFRRGGAERLNLKLVDAVLRHDREARVLIVLTDGADDEAPEWSPAEGPHGARVRVVRMPALPPAGRDEAVRVLARFLLMLRPEAVLCCNSALGWRAFETWGAQLGGAQLGGAQPKGATRLLASVFCYDFDVHGNKVGYVRDHIRETIPHLHAVYTDNRGFARDVVRDFSLGRRAAKKFVPLYQIVDTPRPPERFHDLRAAAQRPRLLWPMRMHRQKRPDILREVALAMPDVLFDMWVPGARWDEALGGGEAPANLRVFGADVSSFEDIDPAPFMALLSTSQWEGLPTVVLEAVAAGLPVVASAVGGVAEAIGPDENAPRGNAPHGNAPHGNAPVGEAARGYLVRPFDDVDGYVAAIRALIADPDEADRRRRRAWAHVSAQHGETAYVETLQSLGLLRAERAADERADAHG